MSDTTLGEYSFIGQPLGWRGGLSFLHGYVSRLTAGLSMRHVAAWIVVDLAIMQCAAVATLFGRLLWLLYRSPGAAIPNLASIGGSYLWTILPLSAVYLLGLFVTHCYSRPLVFSRRQAGRLALRTFGSAAALCFLAIGVGATVHAFEAGAASEFVAFATLGVFGARWLRLWADSPHVTESLPAYVRAATRSEGPILVVGGAGYIGSVLVRRLIAAGKKVRVLDNLVYGDLAIRGLIGHPNLEFLPGDCRNIKSVVSAVEGVNTIFHLAAIVGDPACEQERQTALETNYAATRMLIEVAKGAKVSRLVFASTCSVYGASDQLMNEESAVVPISLYARTKVQSERALLEAASESFHPIVLRLATVFGYSWRPRFDLVVNLLTAKAHQEGVITIYNGQQWRPFVHVRDVADGMLMLLTMPLSVVGGQVLNLGDSRLNFTLAQVAEKVREIFPRTKVEFVDNDDRRNYRVSFGKIQRLTGFQASVGLGDGIRELKAAFERRQIEDYRLALYSNQCFLQNLGGLRNSNDVDSYVMAAFARHFQVLAQTATR